MAAASDAERPAFLSVASVGLYAWAKRTGRSVGALASPLLSPTEMAGASLMWAAALGKPTAARSAPAAR